MKFRYLLALKARRKFIVLKKKCFFQRGKNEITGVVRPVSMWLESRCYMRRYILQSERFPLSLMPIIYLNCCRSPFLMLMLIIIISLIIHLNSCQLKTCFLQWRQKKLQQSRLKRRLEKQRKSEVCRQKTNNYILSINLMPRSLVDGGSTIQS